MSNFLNVLFLFREVWLNRQSETYPSTLLRNERGLTYWKICGEGEPVYCSNRASLLRLSASDHELVEYKKSVLHQSEFYYSTRDTKGFFDWTIALDRSCPSVPRELPFALPQAEGNRKSNNNLPGGASVMDKLEPPRKSADTWLARAKEFAHKGTLLRGGAGGGRLMNGTGVPGDVVYALNALPTSWSKRITPVISSDVPKVIYLKQKQQQKQQQQMFNKHTPTLRHLHRGKTVPVSRAVSPLDDQLSSLHNVPDVLNSGRIISVSAPHPLPRIARPSLRTTKRTPEDTGSHSQHNIATFHENPRPITITHLVVTSSSNAGGEPIPVTHMVRNNPKSPQLLAVRETTDPQHPKHVLPAHSVPIAAPKDEVPTDDGGVFVPRRAPYVTTSQPPSNADTITVPFAIVDEPGGGRRVVSLKQLQQELPGTARAEVITPTTTTTTTATTATERSDTRNLKKRGKGKKDYLDELKSEAGEKNKGLTAIDESSTLGKSAAIETAAKYETNSNNNNNNNNKSTKDVEFESVGDLLAYVHDNIYQFPTKSSQKQQMDSEIAESIRKTDTPEQQRQEPDDLSEKTTIQKTEPDLSQSTSTTFNEINPNQIGKSPTQLSKSNIFDNYVTKIDKKDTDAIEQQQMEKNNKILKEKEVSDLLHVLDAQEHHVKSKGVEGPEGVVSAASEGEGGDDFSESTLNGVSDVLDVLSAQEQHLSSNHRDNSTGATDEPVI